MKRVGILLLLAAILGTSRTWASNVVINEFLANNVDGVLDNHGDNSDWIELYNPTAAAVNLGGWYLTNDRTNLMMCQIPAGVSIAAGAYVLSGTGASTTGQIIYATGLDQMVAGAPLHTNFKLTSGSGYLGLIAADGVTIVSEYAPYPAQTQDVSYGLAADLKTKGFFSPPTPGAANGTQYSGFAPPPNFPTPSGAYAVASLNVLITPAIGGATIRYTTDGTIPGPTSTAIGSSLSVTANTVIKARTFVAGMVPSLTVCRNYYIIDTTDATMTKFSSNLPVMVVDTFGKAFTETTEGNGDRVYNTQEVSYVEIDPTAGGRASITAVPAVSGRVTMGYRGGLSQQEPKLPYKFYTLDDSGTNNNDVALMGNPAEHDWIFYPAYVDKTLLRNVFAFGLWNQMGRYCTGMQAFELFFNTAASGGKLRYTDYQGVYFLQEKIKRGANLVNIQKLHPDDTTTTTDQWHGPISGGYIISKDTLNYGDVGFNTNETGGMTYVYPNETDLDAAAPGGLITNSLQGLWIQHYVQNFEKTIESKNWSLVSGYPSQIDVGAFIDFHVFCEYTRNPDGFRKSNFLFKDRDGLLNEGPVWDWDLSMGNCYYPVNNTTPATYASGEWGWYSQALASQDGTLSYPWYPNLFLDPDFQQKWIDRYAVLRSTIMADTNVLAAINNSVTYLNESQARNFQKWSILNTSIWPNYEVAGSYQGEINFWTGWLQARGAWMDSQFPLPPVLGTASGTVAAGTTVALSLAAGQSGTIYYTTDNSDPRQSGGTVGASAKTYSAPLAINANTKVQARVFNKSAAGVWGGTGVWSAPVTGSYAVHIPQLVVSEIMYHATPPPAGSPYTNGDFEYLEIENADTYTINLAGAQISGDVSYAFTSGSLAPGGYAVLASNPTAFSTRYPNVTPAGQYTGGLSNSGGNLILTGPAGEAILNFTFSSSWYPSTDGSGFSLTIVNPNAALNTWSLMSSWRPSGQFLGSPGAGDTPGPSVAGVLVNEILTHPAAGGHQSIELYNPTSSSVDLSGWYLSDDHGVPQKFQIPSGTSVSALGYIAFDDTQFGGNFTLNAALGSEIYLFSGDMVSGNLTGYRDGFTYDPQASGVTFGRYTISTGAVQYPAQLRTTLGQFNAGPLIGPVVIDEIMYDPAAGSDDFLELVNITGATVPLYDPANPQNVWDLHGLGYYFPLNSSLPPQGVAVLTAMDPTLFRTKYSVPTAVQVFGPYSGNLSLTGENLELRKPDTPVTDPTTGGTIVPYVVVDEVDYTNAAPWPTTPAGTGPSLQRLYPNIYGNDPANWKAGPATPGTAVAWPPTWTGGDDRTTSTWSDALNWNPPAVPQPGTSLPVTFIDAGATAYSAGNNLTGAFTLNQLILNGTVAGNTIAGNALTFDGVQPQIVQENSGPFTIANNLVFNAGTALDGSGGGAVSLTGALSGAGGLLQTGAFALTLAGGAANTYAGTTLFSGGAVTLNQTGGVAIPGALIVNGATVSLSQSNQIAFAAPVTVNAGTLNLNSFSNAIGTLTLGGVAGTATVTGTAASVLTLNGDVTYLAANNAAGALLSAPLKLGGAARTFNVGDSSEAANDLTLSGPIANGSLIKAGAGTLVLSASNIYAGGTAVNAGTLLVNNSAGSGTGTGFVTVSSGATLGGTGIVGGAVTLAGGGILSPGTGLAATDPKGTLTVAGADLSAGGILSVRASNSAAGQPAAADLLSISSAGLTLGSAAQLNLQMSIAAGNYASSLDTVLAQTAAGDLIASAFGGVTATGVIANDAVIVYLNGAGTQVGTQALNGGPTTLSAPANRVILRLIGNVTSTVSTPSITPSSGTFTAFQTVTITCATTGATIHYTLDGSPPAASSPVYTAALTVTATATIKAYATEAGMNDSAVATAVFTYSGPLPPTNIFLSPTSVPEHLPAGTTVGSFTTSDADSAVFTYALVAGVGAADNASFTLSGAVLLTAARFDFAAKNSYSILVQSTDSNNLSVEEQFTISVTQVLPTDIILSNASVPEEQPVGTVVGTFSTSDTDTSATPFTYTLVAGAGSDDNASFIVVGAILETHVIFTQPATLTIRVRSTDNYGNYVEKAFPIAVVPFCNPPTDITLSSASFPDNSPAGTIVGAFSTVEAVSDTFAYTLANGPDEALFDTNQNNLIIVESFAGFSQSSFSILVTSTNSCGLSFTQQFTITTTHINEPPQIALPSPLPVPVAGAVAFASVTNTAITVSDPDGGLYPEQLTVSADNGTLTLATTAGLTFSVGTGFNDPTITCTAPLAALNTALDGMTCMFTPCFSGTCNVTVSLNDLGHTGTGGAQTATQTMTFSGIAGPPVVIASLSAAPNPAAAGTAVQFTSSATVCGATTYQWDFGDGLSGSGASASHSYASPGTYQAVLTAVPATGAPVTAALEVQVGRAVCDTVVLDSDNDGYSDEIETALWGSPTGRPATVPAAAAGAALISPKLMIKLNFAKPNLDRITLTTLIPDGSAFQPQAQTFIIDVGGMVREVALNAKGGAAKGSPYQVKLSPKKKQRDGTYACPCAVNFTKGNFKTPLAKDGLTNATTKAPVQVLTTIIVNNTVFEGCVPLHYKAKKGVSGLANMR